MQAGEGVDIPALTAEIKAKCPFMEPTEDAPELENEDIELDDLESVTSIQENNGGVLGTNLKDAKNGKAGTWNNIYPPDKPSEDPAIDTKRGNGGKVKVDEEEFPYGVAAHHLIPGNGSLTSSEVYKYMVKGDSVQDEAGNTWTMKYHIGYNVNGAHNGVWLPGNYSIRAGKTSKNATWSVLMGSDLDWCRKYVAALVKKKVKQFHDTHSEYNDTVRETLDKISTALLEHQSACDECKKQTEVAPPYRIKIRLYGLSSWLKVQLAGPPDCWRIPYVTSDQWKSELLSPVNRAAFQKAYEEANP